MAKQLKKAIEAEDQEAIKDIEDEITMHEKAGSILPDWTIHDMKNFYKEKLRERKEDLTTLQRRKETGILSFSERVEYYRELLSQRN